MIPNGRRGTKIERVRNPGKSGKTLEKSGWVTEFAWTRRSEILSSSQKKCNEFFETYLAGVLTTA